MSQSLPPRRLLVEQLEDRLTPSFGTPWTDPTHLTLSFAPDGTNITGQASDLFALMGSTTGQAQWQQAILSAYQTWADAANVNIGLVADGGEALGIAGAPQGDIRFGDIRIAARALSAPGTPGSTMADTAGFDYNDQTTAGDSVYNNLYQFGIGNIPGVQSDLYSVALHEAGHSLGLADQNTDPTSAMYAAYQGVLSGLSASDIAALQALYGARPTDPYGSASGNGTMTTAYNLGNATTLSGQISQIGDVDMFQFTTPSSGATALTINLNAAGISLFTGQVTILNAQGNVVASATTTDPTNNNLSIAIPNYQPSSTYYIKVAGASTNVFSMGSYVLNLNYAGGYQGGQGGDRDHYINIEPSDQNVSQTNAMNLLSVHTVQQNTFTLSGAIHNPSASKWYQITPTMPTATTGTLFVGTTSLTHGLDPSISIYDAQGNMLPAVVAMDQNGAYEVQLANATSGATYYIKVTSEDGQTTGGFTLGATLAPVAPTTFAPVVSDTLTTANAINSTQLTVTGDRLVQFALTATGGSTTSATAVRATILNAAGQMVFTFATFAGQPLATGSVWLGSGTYTIVFGAATQNGSAIQSLNVSLAARSLTDPIDPYPVDPTDPPPPPQAPISAPVPPPTTPPAPILDAILSPLIDILDTPPL